jgi:hypothetical protein
MSSDLETLQDVLAAQEQLDTLDWMMSGNPLPVMVGGRRFGLRQLDGVEYERMRQIERMAYVVAFHSDDLQPLRDIPESIDVVQQRAFDRGFLIAKHEVETDPEKRRELSAQLDELERLDKEHPNAAGTEATRRSQIERDRWLMETCLVEPDGESLEEEERNRILAWPGFFETIQPSIWKLIISMRQVPNWNGRKLSSIT